MTLDSRMTLQVAASLTIVILTKQEVSLMLPENINSTGVNHDDCRDDDDYDCNMFIEEATEWQYQSVEAKIIWP
jgi:hypothetical protein